MKNRLDILLQKMKPWLSKFSMKVGVILLLLCVPFHILFLLQFKLPIGPVGKSILGVVTFGLAKIFQYSGLFIVGAKGLKDLKKIFTERKQNK